MKTQNSGQIPKKKKIKETIPVIFIIIENKKIPMNVNIDNGHFKITVYI